MAKKLWYVQTGTGRSVTAARWALLMLLVMLGLPAVAAAQTPVLPASCAVTAPSATSARRDFNSQPSIDATGTHIAFWSTSDLTGNNVDGNIEVFEANLDAACTVGPVYRQITNSTGNILGGFNLWPSMNAQGNRIALFSDRNLTGGNFDANFEIFVYNSSTNTLKQITNTSGGANTQPAIDATGSHIAFVSDRNLDPAVGNADGNQEVFLATIDASGAVRFTQLTATVNGINDQPAISGDGSRVTFVSNQDLIPATGNADGNSEVFVYDVVAGKLAQVTNTQGGNNSQPAINADGTAIVFASDLDLAGRNPQHYPELFLARLQSGGGYTFTQLTTPVAGVVNEQPAVSADGTRVVYVSNGGVRMHDTATHEDMLLGTGADGNSRPSLSGNGMYVSFATDRQIHRVGWSLGDLAVTLSSQPHYGVPGAAITYTLVAMNSGPGSAVGALVSDTLPSVIRSPRWTCQASVGSSCVSGQALEATSGTGRVISQTVDLEPGGSATYILTGVMDPSAPGGQMTNVAEVRAPLLFSDHDATNNRAVDINQVLPEVDLGVQLQAPITVTAGTGLSYTLVYTNAGPSNGTKGITIAASLPAGITWDGAITTDPPVASHNSQQVTWTLPSLTARQGGTIRFRAAASAHASGLLAATASITSTLSDPEPGNNLALATTEVIALADLQIQTQTPPRIIAGTTISYTLVYTNAGPSDALGVSITHTLPANAIWEGVLGGPAVRHSGSQLVWDLGRLTPQTTGSLQITVSVPANVIGNLSSSATIAGSVLDPEPANNTTTSTQPLVTSADLYLAADATGTVVAGQVLTYSLSFGNAGPSDAGGVVVTDTLPPGVIWGGMVTGKEPDSRVGQALSWNLGTLASSATGSLWFTATVASSATGRLTDWAGITSNADDPLASNNRDSAGTDVSAQADLEVTLGATAGVLAGMPVTYTLSYSNHGPSDAQAVVISVTLPVGSAWDALISGPVPGSQSGRHTTWTLAEVAAHSTGTIVFTAQVAPETLGTISASADIASAAEDPVGANNSASAVTSVTAAADLRVGLQAPSVTAGQPITYTVVYTNTGPSNAVGINVTATLPAGVTWGGMVSGPAPASQVGRQLSWNLGALASGISSSLQFTVSTSSSLAGTVSASAGITGDTSDPVSGNNLATLTRSVTVAADLRVWLSGPAGVFPGGVLTYTLSYRNAGPADAPGVILTQTLPTGTSWGGMISGAAPARVAGGQVGWDIGPVPAGAAASMQFTANTALDAAGTLTANAQVTSSAADPRPTDNLAAASTTVNPLADLQLSHVPAATTLTAGGRITFTLTYTNSGPSNATSVILTDTLPAGLSWGAMVSGPSPASTSGGQLRWNLGSVGRGQHASLTFYATAPATASGSFVSRAQVSSAATDLRPLDNFADATVDLAQSALLVSIAPHLQSVASGGTASFTIYVTNTSGTKLTSLVVTDPLVTGCEWTANHLNAYTSDTRTCTRTGVTADFTHTVRAQATSGSITLVATDQATVRVRVTGVGLAGPATASRSVMVPFTATIAPAASLPITYTWTANGQTPQVHAARPSLTDSISLSWPVTGTQTVTVTATNAWGTAQATHTLAITESVGLVSNMPAVALVRRWVGSLLPYN